MISLSKIFICISTHPNLFPLHMRDEILSIQCNFLEPTSLWLLTGWNSPSLLIYSLLYIKILSFLSLKIFSPLTLPPSAYYHILPCFPFSSKMQVSTSCLPPPPFPLHCGVPRQLGATVTLFGNALTKVINVSSIVTANGCFNHYLKRSLLRFIVLTSQFFPLKNPTPTAWMTSLCWFYSLFWLLRVSHHSSFYPLNTRVLVKMTAAHSNSRAVSF